jgi:protease I
MMKKALALIVFAAAALAASVLLAQDAKKLEGRKVLMVIASGNFRDEEYSIPRAALEAQGARVTVASSKLTESVGMLKQQKVKPDALVSKVEADDYDAIVFIGGVGAKEYFADKSALKLAQEAFKQEKIVAAICLAPSILANAGVLKGKKGTVYKSEEENLKKCGCEYTGAPVEVDGNVITANGPEAAQQFTDELVKALEAFKILTGKKIVMIIAQEKFRDEELAKPKEIFTEKGAEVTIAAPKKEKCKGMLGAEVEPDTTISKVKPEDYDAIILVGGVGAKDFFEDKKMHALVKKAESKDKIVAAICMAPVILANAGLLKGKDATVFAAMKDALAEKGANYKEEAVVSDGKIVTGNGPEAAEAFANEVIKKLRE